MPTNKIYKLKSMHNDVIMYLTAGFDIFMPHNQVFILTNVSNTKAFLIQTFEPFDKSYILLTPKKNF